MVTALPPTQSYAAGISQDGTDFSYFVQLNLGSTGKPVWMLLDTGAATTWVMGKYCTSSPCAMHNNFGPDDSTTLKISSTPFSVQYGSGSVGGWIGTDTVSFAGTTMPYQFGLANRTSDDFVHFAFDGILGMSMSNGQTQNYMQTLKASKQISANVFGVYLSRNADGPNTGEISFGAPDKAKYTGDLVYTAVAASAGGDWAIPLDSISYDGKATGVAGGKLAYLDTGTSFVFGPKADVAALYKLIPGAASADGEIWTVPCNNNLPLAFSFSGVTYTVLPQDWISPPSSSGACTGNIYGREVVPGAWLLGDVFLKNVYAVFDADQTRIGKEPSSLATIDTASLMSFTGLAKRVAVAVPASSPPTTPSLSPTVIPSNGTPTTLITKPPPTAPGSSTKPTEGVSGHETGGATGTAAAETAGAPAAPAQSSSPGEQLQGSNIASIVIVLVAVVMAA